MVRDYPTGLGDYPSGFAWTGAMIGSPSEMDTLYTLLPPHLAEQWKELRKAKAEAERRLREAMNVKARFMDAAYLQWCESTDALAAFEKQHGIGGGA